jgi:hypothetical protein
MHPSRKEAGCMSLQAVSSAATIALASTIVILLAIKSWHLMAQPFAGIRSFPNSIMTEAAQRFRDQLERLRGEQSLYLALTLMFAVTFGVAIVLRPQDTFGDLPAWQNIAVLVIVLLGAAYGLYRFIRVILERRRVAFVRDANIAVGHSLQKLTANQNRVFHEVRCPAGVIDNVVVGLHGIYAVNVVAIRPRKDNRVRLCKDELSFAPGKQVVSVSDAGLKAKQIAKVLRKQTGHDIRVRPVIAVPGWEIESQASEQYLVVNERNLGMMHGWKDERDYLMNEDVDTIHSFLTEDGTHSARK